MTGIGPLEHVASGNTESTSTEQAEASGAEVSRQRAKLPILEVDPMDALTDVACRKQPDLPIPRFGRVAGCLFYASRGSSRDVYTIGESEPLENTIQEGTLMHFNLRFGHLNVDNIEQRARDPVRGVHLTDHIRKDCLTCSERKVAPSKKDSGTNSPTYIVGAVVHSGLKGTITPIDKNKNMYMINFVYHKVILWSRILAKSKD